MDRPEKKPAPKLLELYELGKVRSVNIDLEQTQENESGANEMDGFHFDVVINIYSASGGMQVNESQFNCWLDWHPDTDHLWVMKRDLWKVCDEWAKFLRCEARDLQTFERLKKKFA